MAKARRKTVKVTDLAGRTNFSVLTTTHIYGGINKAAEMFETAKTTFQYLDVYAGFNYYLTTAQLEKFLREYIEANDNIVYMTEGDINTIIDAHKVAISRAEDNFYRETGKDELDYHDAECISFIAKEMQLDNFVYIH